jgi:hypothetical protein
MGTPHDRWREMHQSFLPETIGRMRFAPEAGMNSMSSNAASASSLNPSTEANHWLVARKIVGFFVRQSYGYLCPYDSCKIKPSFERSNSMHLGVAVAEHVQTFQSLAGFVGEVAAVIHRR